MKPIIKYRGGKSKEIKYILNHIPENFERYIEPFFGGGALYFYLEPQRAIINDINTKLIDFYKNVKEDFLTLKKELKLLQEEYEANQEKYEKLKILNPEIRVENKNEELYYKIREMFNYAEKSDFLHGTTYFFINKTAYSGMIRYNKKGEYNVPFGRYKNFNTDLIDQKHYELLKNSEIYNCDFSKIFEMAGENDFIFLDPPYDCVFSEYGNEVFSGDFGENEHRRLAKEFEKSKCKCLMVISKTPLIEELYSNFIVEEYDVNYAVNIRNRFKNEAKHVIIKNY